MSVVIVNIGYARVSTKEQNLDRQITSLKEAGCEEIFIDKATGTNFQRTEYMKMKKFIRKGDTLFVHDLSRLGRNKDMMKEELRDLMDKDIYFVCLNMSMIDTRKFADMPNMEKLVFNLIIEIVTHFAEEEWKNRKDAQMQGIDVALKQGKYKGKPPVYSPDGTKSGVYYAIIQMLDQGLTIQEISGKTKASRSTIQRIKRNRKSEKHIQSI